MKKLSFNDILSDDEKRKEKIRELSEDMASLSDLRKRAGHEADEEYLTLQEQDAALKFLLEKDDAGFLDFLNGKGLGDPDPLPDCADFDCPVSSLTAAELSKSMKKAYDDGTFSLFSRKALISLLDFVYETEDSLVPYKESPLLEDNCRFLESLAGSCFFEAFPQEKIKTCAFLFRDIDSCVVSSSRAFSYKSALTKFCKGADEEDMSFLREAGLDFVLEKGWDDDVSCLKEACSLTRDVSCAAIYALSQSGLRYDGARSFAKDILSSGEVFCSRLSSFVKGERDLEEDFQVSAFPSLSEASASQMKRAALWMLGKDCPEYPSFEETVFSEPFIPEEKPLKLFTALSFGYDKDTVPFFRDLIKDAAGSYIKSLCTPASLEAAVADGLGLKSEMFGLDSYAAQILTEHRPDLFKSYMDDVRFSLSSEKDGLSVIKTEISWPEDLSSYLCKALMRYGMVWGFSRKAANEVLCCVEDKDLPLTEPERTEILKSLFYGIDEFLDRKKAENAVSVFCTFKACREKGLLSEEKARFLETKLCFLMHGSFFSEKVSLKLCDEETLLKLCEELFKKETSPPEADERQR